MMKDSLTWEKFHILLQRLKFRLMPVGKKKDPAALTIALQVILDVGYLSRVIRTAKLSRFDSIVPFDRYRTWRCNRIFERQGCGICNTK